MSRGRGDALALSLAVGVACLASACSKSDENKPVHTFDLRVRPGPQPVGVSAEPVEAAAPVPSEIPWPQENAQADLPSVGAPTSPAPAPKPAPTPAPSAKTNPDDTVLEQARVACGQCFSALPAQAGAPDRSAHVSLTVVPTGTVSRAEVTSDDTTEASVLECIQRAGESAVFSDNGSGPLRSYAIDVRVHASRSNGGR